MNPSDKESHFAEREEAIASTAALTRTLSPPDIARHEANLAQMNGHAVPGNPNNATTGSNPRTASSKYRHITAIHLRAQTSCLSRDAEVTPSFLGFRNLMVIVLSTCFFIVKDGPYQKYYQTGLTKSLSSCNESTTSHRKFY